MIGMIRVLKTFYGSYRIWILLAAFISSIGGTGWLIHSYKEGQYAKRDLKASKEYVESLMRQQEEYNKRIQELNDAALKRQKELADLNTQIERKYHDAERKANENHAKWRDAVNNGFRLRDKYAKELARLQDSRIAKGGDSGTTNSSNPTTSEGELSRESTEFLLKFAADADRVVEQLRAAQEYAKSLHSICKR